MKRLRNGFKLFFLKAFKYYYYYRKNIVISEV